MMLPTNFKLILFHRITLFLLRLIFFFNNVTADHACKFTIPFAWRPIIKFSIDRPGGARLHNKSPRSLRRPIWIWIHKRKIMLTSFVISGHCVLLLNQCVVISHHNVLSLKILFYIHFEMTGAYKKQWKRIFQLIQEYVFVWNIIYLITYLTFFFIW